MPADWMIGAFTLGGAALGSGITLYGQKRLDDRRMEDERDQTARALAAAKTELIVELYAIGVALSDIRIGSESREFRHLLTDRPNWLRLSERLAHESSYRTVSIAYTLASAVAHNLDGLDAERAASEAEDALKPVVRAMEEPGADEGLTTRLLLDVE